MRGAYIDYCGACDVCEGVHPFISGLRAVLQEMKEEGVTAKTPAERKAAERQRRSDAGLVRLELYAHPEDHASIKEHAAKLQRKREKAHSTPPCSRS